MTGSADGEGLVLRRARVADLDAVAAIERSAFSDPWSRRSFADLIDHRTARFVVAELAGRVVGYLIAWYVADEAEVANIAIAPEARRRGIARRLLEAAIEEGRRRETASVYLEVRESNAPARALYASRGFEEIGRRPRYYARPTEDAIVMRKALAEG